MARLSARFKSGMIWILMVCLIIPYMAGGEAAKAEAAAPENWIINPGFENVSDGRPVGWGHSAGQWGVDFGISTEQARTGTYSAFINHSTGDGLPNIIALEKLSIQDSEEYVFSAWLKVEDKSMTGTPMLNMDFYGDEINEVTGDTWIGSKNQPLAKGEITGDWQQLTYRFTPLPGSNKVVIYLMVAGGTGKVYFDDASFLPAAAEPEPELGPYQIWTGPNTVNMTRTAKPLASTDLKLDMAKREYQSGQVFVTAQDGRAEITSAFISDLTSGEAVIPSSSVQILVQHYVKIDKNSNGAYQPGEYPDALIPLDAFMSVHGKVNVKQGQNQSIWFTVKTEETTPAGIYQGTITLTVNGETKAVPVEVRVRDFAIPEENHAETAFAIWGGDMLLAGHPGIANNSDAYWELMRNYYEFMLDYHVTPTALPIPTDDYVQYVKDAEPYINDPRVSAYNLPYTIGDLDDPVNGRAAMLIKDLKAKGLLDKAYYYLGGEIDEPTPAMFPKVIERSEQIKAIEPTLRHLVTTGINPELSAAVNTFTPLFNEFNTESYLHAAHEHQANGGHIWWYGCVAPKNPYPTYHIDDDIIGARLVPWMQRSYGIEGNLYWSVNIFKKYDGTKYIDRDIWNDSFAFPGANGDGYLLYPGTKYGINGPIATLRLQTIRDGNQDYEYLWLLEQKINQAAENLNVNVTVNDILKPYYDRLFTDVKTFTKDVNVLQSVRSEVADMIEQLDQDPKALILLSNHATDASKRDITIYAAKGTEVSVDGQAVAAETITDNETADQYKTAVSVVPGTNEITVVLKKDGRELTVKKQVVVKSRAIEPIMKKTVINNFSDEQSLAGIVKEYRVTIEGTSDDHAPGGGKSLKVKIPYLEGEAYPGIRLPVAAGLKDFSEADSLELDVYNDSSQTMNLFAKFFDAQGKPSDHKIGTLLPGANHLALPLAQLGQIDKKNIASILFWTLSGSSEVTFYFSDVHLMGVDKEAMKTFQIRYTPIVPDLSGRLDGAVWKLDKQLAYTTGNTEINAAYDLKYNDTYLYIGVDVTDNEVVNGNAADPWDDDSVEVYLDGIGAKGVYNEHTVRYVFRYDDDQVHAYGLLNQQTGGILHQSDRTADGYAMKIAIPWRVIGTSPSNGDVISFTMHVNDAGHGKRSLTQDISADATSSEHWADRVFVNEKVTYAMDSIADDRVVINGKPDESFWNLDYNLGQQTFGFTVDKQNAAKLGLRWSPSHLYAAFDVTDSLVHAPKVKPVWEETSVELFIDGKFIQGPRDAFSPQYTIRFGDDTVYLNGAAKDDKQGIVHQTVKTDKGYQVEMAIPWEAIGITAEEGQWMGIASHVNFYQESGGAVLGLTENGISDVSNTANYLAFQLRSSMPEPVPVAAIAVTGAGNAGTIAQKNGTLQMEAAVTPANADVKTVSWAVFSEDGRSATDLAVITPAGLLGAKKNGKVRVVATAQDGSGVQGYAIITIGGQTTDPGTYYPGTVTGTVTGPTEEKNTEAAVRIENGTAIVTMEADRTTVSIPIAKLLGNPVRVEAGGAVITIDPAVWKDLIAQSDSEKAVIRLSIVPVDDSEVNPSAGAGAGRLQLASQAYDIHMVLKTADGKEIPLSQAAGGVKLELPYRSNGADEGLLGIYHYNEATQRWEYVGGKVNAKDGLVEVRLDHLSRYAVLSYSKRFADVPSGHWAYRTLQLLSAKHIVTGVTDEEFKPGNRTTRAEFVTLLVRALNLTEQGGELPFTDVPENAWYKDQLSAAYSAGLIQGINEHTFHPEGSITREEMAVLLVRAYESLIEGKERSAGDQAAVYADQNQISPWAEESIHKAAIQGLMIGQAGERFAPNDNATRAECAKAVYNLMKAAGLL
ncbi:glycoside hydrolase domain-containing protein [Paenibacillus spongiae]|uniref:DUF6067 family protein n=1 Tax=Paenibacillus spongiae TaxID=2909671 RepID=A0ABY5S9K8_9BACL|nr:glycoside hydrolase domain-containing protein [Paenibacillus spongiae]UVI30409.1 DUF6067 family protein [Paenibacillus spongiae]